MKKEAVIRSRVNQKLKDRVGAYMKREAARGRALSESDVLLEAVVDYLDRHEKAGNASALARIADDTKASTDRLNEPIHPYRTHKSK